jgi:hypothetical protein
MELTLSAQEAALIKDILEERHLALQREIARTDHREFKQILRERERILQSVLERVQSGMPRAA